MELVCQFCSNSFNGDARRLYCSAICRRRMEFKRRDWDKTAALLSLEGLYSRNASNHRLSEHQRAQWRQRWRQARESFERFGPRP